jgi:hypothetical protein
LSDIATHNANICHLPPPLRANRGAEMSPRSELAD